MKKKYDTIISIGEACVCTETLRKAHLVFESYPFDWNAGIDLNTRADIILDDFKDYFEKENLEKTEGKGGRPGRETILVINKKNHIHFVHDFLACRSFDENYEIAHARYQRRIKRFYDNINNAENTLLVFIEYQYSKTPLTDKKDLITSYNKIKQRFPNKNIDLLYIQPDNTLEFNHREKEYITENIIYNKFRYTKNIDDIANSKTEYKLLIKAIKEYADLNISIFEKANKYITTLIHLAKKKGQVREL